jgi:prophage maintenance system killer protein
MFHLSTETRGRASQLAATFLELNGLEFTATEESVIEMTLALVSGKMEQAAYAEWLSKNSRAG